MNPQETPQPHSGEQPNNPIQPPQPPQSDLAYPPAGSQPQIVYMSRPMEPQHVEISPETLRKHEESKKKYPSLNLSKGEYVISAIQRHPIGLVQIWIVVGFIILALLAIAVFLSSASTTTTLGETASLPMTILAIPLILISILVLLFGYIASYIYNANKFFLTNESVIQQIQTSMFSKREQTVSLANVEDASYSQDGIITHVFDYGMIRLSTEGDETTYRFKYASHPRHQISILNDAVEAFKNGRPVGHDVN